MGTVVILIYINHVNDNFWQHICCLYSRLKMLEAVWFVLEEILGKCHRRSLPFDVPDEILWELQWVWRSCCSPRLQRDPDTASVLEMFWRQTLPRQRQHDYLGSYQTNCYSGKNQKVKRPLNVMNMINRSSLSVGPLWVSVCISKVTGSNTSPDPLSPGGGRDGEASGRERPVTNFQRPAEWINAGMRPSSVLMSTSSAVVWSSSSYPAANPATKI